MDLMHCDCSVSFSTAGVDARDLRALRARE